MSEDVAKPHRESTSNSLNEPPLTNAHRHLQAVCFQKGKHDLVACGGIRRECQAVACCRLKIDRYVCCVGIEALEHLRRVNLVVAVTTAHRVVILAKEELSESVLSARTPPISKEIVIEAGNG